MAFQIYIKQQIKFIKIYAKHFHLTDEEAAYKWGTTNLAEKYNELYK